MSYDEIRAALAAATPGPWARWVDMDAVPEMRGLLMVGVADEVIPDGEFAVNTREPDGASPVAECYIYADARLIANAPTWLAELLDENERQAALLAEVRETAEAYGPIVPDLGPIILRVLDGGEHS